MMGKIELSMARPGDERILAHIQSESWRSAFSGILSPVEIENGADPVRAELMYSHVLSGGRIRLAIGYVDGAPQCIAGWSGDRKGLEADTAELICIHSLSGKRRQGYGSAMLGFILEGMREDGYSGAVLWVFERNYSARCFYEKHGFNATGERNLAHGAVEMLYSRKL